MIQGQAWNPKTSWSQVRTDDLRSNRIAETPKITGLLNTNHMVE